MRTKQKYAMCLKNFLEQTMAGMVKVINMTLLKKELEFHDMKRIYKNKFGIIKESKKKKKKICG